MSGYVYILSNPSIPGLLKIGHTLDNPEHRLRQLNTTSVPKPFVLEACFLVANPAELEQSIQATLAQYRPSQNREFFQLSLSQALELAHPLVIQAVGTSGHADSESPPNNLGLSENEVCILQLLVASRQLRGESQWRLERCSGVDGLDVDICIANLVEKKFIQRSRDVGGSGPFWRSTPKGTKFLVDNNLIVDWMREWLPSGG